MPHVYSTLTNSSTYNLVVDKSNYPQGIPHVLKSVTIKGGTGLANKQLITPWGVKTEVTGEELELLLKNTAFVRHRDKGFLTVRDEDINPEKVAADMETRDGCAPLVPEDFKKEVAPSEDKPVTIRERFAGKRKG